MRPSRLSSQGRRVPAEQCRRTEPPAVGAVRPSTGSKPNGGDSMEATWKPHERHGDLTERSDLPDSVFAFPKQRKEPMTDASHVRNAIARFDQTMTANWLSPTSRKRPSITVSIWARMTGRSLAGIRALAGPPRTVASRPRRRRPRERQGSTPKHSSLKAGRKAAEGPHSTRNTGSGRLDLLYAASRL